MKNTTMYISLAYPGGGGTLCSHPANSTFYAPNGKCSKTIYIKTNFNRNRAKHA